MIYFEHDPTNLYFPNGMIRIARWLFDFAARTPNEAKCFCNPEWLDENQALRMASIHQIAVKLEDIL